MADESLLKFLLIKSIPDWNQFFEEFVSQGNTVDLTYADLTGRAFDRILLEGADFTNAVLRACNFDYARLQRVIFKGADLTKARFVQANLERAQLENTNLEGAQFTEAKLHEANFAGARLKNTNFSKSNLTGAVFEGADISDTNFTGAVLHSVDLRGMNLSSANFTDAEMNLTNLGQANLSKTNLAGARLGGANLVGAIISKNTQGLNSLTGEQIALLRLDNPGIRSADPNAGPQSSEAGKSQVSKDDLVTGLENALPSRTVSFSADVGGRREDQYRLSADHRFSQSGCVNPRPCGSDWLAKRRRTTGRIGC